MYRCYLLRGAQKEESSFAGALRSTQGAEDALNLQRAWGVYKKKQGVVLALARPGQAWPGSLPPICHRNSGDRTDLAKMRPAFREALFNFSWTTTLFCSGSVVCRGQHQLLPRVLLSPFSFPPFLLCPLFHRYTSFPASPPTSSPTSHNGPRRQAAVAGRRQR